MAKVRKIQREPDGKNWFVIDACFLANRFIPSSRAPTGRERNRIVQCMDWWNEIDSQIANDRARVYAPDICIAETFKVLAKKYYHEQWFKSAQDFHYWRGQLRNRISLTRKELRKANRKIEFHDVESNRDIIVAVDRFYELFFKNNQPGVSVPDLIVVATAKWLMDFFDAPRERLHIVTLDRSLRDGSKKIQELPNAYDPTMPEDNLSRVFV